MADLDQTYQNAVSAHAHHLGMSLDKNQSRESREHHEEQCKRAEGVILELLDLEGD